MLDTLAAACGCLVLSDLNGQLLREETRRRLLPVLRGIAAERYPLEDWQEACRYIAGREPQGRTAQACREELLHALEGRKSGLPRRKC